MHSEGSKLEVVHAYLNTCMPNMFLDLPIELPD